MLQQQPPPLGGRLFGTCIMVMSHGTHLRIMPQYCLAEALALREPPPPFGGVPPSRRWCPCGRLRPLRGRGHHHRRRGGWHHCTWRAASRHDLEQNRCKDHITNSCMASLCCSTPDTYSYVIKLYAQLQGTSMCIKCMRHRLRMCIKCLRSGLLLRHCRCWRGGPWDGLQRRWQCHTITTKRQNE